MMLVIKSNLNPKIHFLLEIFLCQSLVIASGNNQQDDQKLADKCSVG
jgi:hypothetical protein